MLKKLVICATLLCASIAQADLDDHVLEVKGKWQVIYPTSAPGEAGKQNVKWNSLTFNTQDEAVGFLKEANVTPIDLQTLLNNAKGRLPQVVGSVVNYLNTEYAASIEVDTSKDSGSFFVKNPTKIYGFEYRLKGKDSLKAKLFKAISRATDQKPFVYEYTINDVIAMRVITLNDKASKEIGENLKQVLSLNNATLRFNDGITGTLNARIGSQSILAYPDIFEIQVPTVFTAIYFGLNTAMYKTQYSDSAYQKTLGNYGETLCHLGRLCGSAEFQKQIQGMTVAEVRSWVRTNGLGLLNQFYPKKGEMTYSPIDTDFLKSVGHATDAVVSGVKQGGGMKYTGYSDVLFKTQGIEFFEFDTEGNAKSSFGGDLVLPEHRHDFVQLMKDLGIF